MGDSMAYCRECLDWFPAEEVKTYFVVRDGGDEYPGTSLCEECADEYRHDDDVESIEEDNYA